MRVTPMGRGDRSRRSISGQTHSRSFDSRISCDRASGRHQIGDPALGSMPQLGEDAALRRHRNRIAPGRGADELEPRPRPVALSPGRRPVAARGAPVLRQDSQVGSGHGPLTFELRIVGTYAQDSAGHLERARQRGPGVLPTPLCWRAVGQGSRSWRLRRGPLRPEQAEELFPDRFRVQSPVVAAADGEMTTPLHLPRHCERGLVGITEEQRVADASVAVAHRRWICRRLSVDQVHRRLDILRQLVQGILEVRSCCAVALAESDRDRAGRDVIAVPLHLCCPVRSTAVEASPSLLCAPAHPARSARSQSLRRRR